jgi:hypothetical protein
MKRFTMNLLALAVVAAGGTFLASPAGATLNSTVEATCGSCSGVCCGFNENGTCWANDKCAES